MKDPIVTLRKHDDLLTRLLQELAAPAWPAHRLPAACLPLARQPIRRGQGEHQQGKQHMHAHRPCRFLWWMTQVPLLLGFLDTTVLDETAVVIILKGLQRLLDRGVRQEHGFATWTIVLPTPLPHHHGIDGVALE